MRHFILIGMLLLSCHQAFGQHDLYKWQISGYTGIANYLNSGNSTSDYIKINDNLLHRLELTRNIGYGVALSASYSYGSVRGLGQQQNTFRTNVRMSSVRAYFYADNGMWFNTSAWISPYLFAGYGVSILETSYANTTEESRYVPAIPFGLGIKFRLAERWQLSLQSEVVYLTKPHLEVSALEQNDFNSAYIHTGLTLGYSFGFRTSTFKAPRFYADNVALLQSVEGQSQPRQNVLEAMLKLEPERVQVNTPDAGAVIDQPAITKRPVALPADTTYTNNRTETQLRTAQLVPAERVQNQDTAQQILTKKQPVQAEILPDSAALTGSVPAVAPTKRAIATDTAVTTQPTTAAPQQRQTQQPATATPQQRQQQAVTTTPQAQQPPATTRQVPVQQQQTTQPQTVPPQQRPVTTTPTRDPYLNPQPARPTDRVIYVPGETRGAGVQGTDVTTALLLQEERRRLEEMNLEISRMRSRIDSLQAVEQSDTVRIETETATDTTMASYLQQQTARNDSIRQRLNQYEQELAMLKKANAAPAPAPAKAAPKGYTTTVFFPINAHDVPAESLRDVQQVLQTLQENPAMQARLTGYTSQSGNAAYNMALSRKRVESLVSLLTDQGIGKERISIQYMGDAKASQKENPLDRKVEIEIFE